MNTCVLANYKLIKIIHPYWSPATCVVAWRDPQAAGALQQGYVTIAINPRQKPGCLLKKPGFGVWVDQHCGKLYHRAGQLLQALELIW